MKTRWIAPIVALMAASAALALVGGTVIKWTPKQGAKLKFKLDGVAQMEIPGAGAGEVTVKGTLEQLNKEVKEDKITVEQKQTAMDIRFNGESVGDVPDSTSTSVVKPNGEEISSTSTTPEEMQSPRMDLLSRFIFPKDQIEENGTWKHTVAKTDKVFTTEYEFKYLGVEEVNGVKCWKVSVTIKETDAPTNMTGAGTAWLDSADGELYKAEMDGKNVPLNPMIPPASFKMKVTRVAD